MSLLMPRQLCPLLLRERERYRAILELGLPSMIAMLSQSAVNEIDVLFFSRLPHHESSNAQAALLPSLIVFWLLAGSLSSINTGTQTLTARRFAEGDCRRAGSVLTSALFFCIPAGAIGSIAGTLLLPSLLRMMIKAPEVRAIAIDYCRWRVLGIIPMSMTMVMKAFFDGIRRPHIHMISALVMNAINVLLCWMFIYGHWGAPRLGAAGAGLSAFLATWIGFLIITVYAVKAEKEFTLLRSSQISRKTITDILRLSLPAALATATLMVGFGLFAKIVSKLDTPHYVQLRDKAIGSSAPLQPAEAVNGAATTDTVAVLKLTLTATIAFGTATATLVSQSLGAKRPEAAAQYGWASVRLGCFIFGFIGLCEGVLFTPLIVHAITQSEAVQQAVMLPMRLMGLSTPLIAVAMILSEALFGAGNTRFVALAQLVLVFGCLVPTAFFLGITLHLGLVGIWSAAALYAALAAATMLMKFRASSWQKINL